MHKDQEILEQSEGWKRLTDMLRASHTVKSAQDVLDTIALLDQSDRVTIMRLKPRFGPKKKNLNDVTVNFDYMGRMVCELQIKLGGGKTPLLYHANHFVYEIERVCASNDRFKLFEAYNKALIGPTTTGKTFDSGLNRNEAVGDQKEEMTRLIPVFETLFGSDCTNFKANLENLDANLTEQFCTWLADQKEWLDKSLAQAKTNFDAYVWSRDMYETFLRTLFERDVIERRYYDEEIHHSGDEDHLKSIIARRLNSLKYPADPNDIAAESRKVLLLDYGKLLDEGYVPFKPRNPFHKLKEFKLEGTSCAYYGQVTQLDDERFVPDGVGIAVDERGYIVEGSFNAGVLEPTYREFSEYDKVSQTWKWKCLFINGEKGYTVTFRHETEGSHWPIFHKVNVFEFKDYESKTYWREDADELANLLENEFDYNKYFIATSKEVKGQTGCNIF